MSRMGRHLEVRGGRRATPSTRPRYKRLSAAGAAVFVTFVAVLGGMGVLPAETETAQAASLQPRAGEIREADEAGTPDRGAARLTAADTTVRPSVPETVPEDSGSGRRIVFDISEQRVWLVGAKADEVRRTYLVSGSVTDNLQPGTYSVYSKSEQAWGIDDSGTMRYMVRFAHGPNAAIGFHDIPEQDGEKVQGRDALGTPQSHGCIRQWRPDAKALWDFAPVGTTVVVVA